MRINFNIYILTADLGYGVLDELLKEFPERCINIGIAEQNMIGIAAGLALSGKKVFCYSIVPFVTMRCYEQIRIDICSHNLDVTLIGIGGGFAYGTLGNTHYGIEDINIMRGLPNMRIFSPADKIEMKAGLDILLEEKYPTYIRLNRGGEKNIHLSEINNDVDIKKGIELHKGKDIIMFTTGYISSIAIEVAKELMKENISIKVVSIPFLKPLNYENIINIIKGFSHVLSLEEHSIIGGLGSSIAEIIAERNIQTTFKRIGINDTFFYLAGNQEYMRELAGIDKKSIINIVKSVL